MNTSRTLGRRRVATFSGPIWRGEQGWGAAAAGATAQTNARRRPHHTECLAQIDERSQRAKPYRPEESCVRGIILKANAASELTVNALESGILLPAARSLPGATRLAQCSRRLNRSRRLQHPDLERPDLVIGMERRHVREVAVLDRDAFERTFTLPDLAARAEAHDPRRPGEGVRDYLRRISAGRRPGDVLGVGDDEVADPYGRNAAAYRRAADEIESLLDVVVPRLFP